MLKPSLTFTIIYTEINKVIECIIFPPIVDFMEKYQPG